MNNVIMRTVAVTSGYRPLVSGRLVATVTISCPPTNVGNVIFEGDDGAEVAWIPGQWDTFQSIDLASIRVKGNSGDVVTIVGGTW